ncbi:hypothetical protein EJ03DRAFT_2825 [Teratosphaeria nubilosa]|uniref:Uncharacterized protein n=1 Tax=Teratosphaeria nubilosa TaxID=161662 RepID=A0A6G1LMN4_9PEZI|nr:hypothetical protein EJ03DRAFT_2825 [Teratosphaeria nubilosa]
MGQRGSNDMEGTMYTDLSRFRRSDLPTAHSAERCHEHAETAASMSKLPEWPIPWSLLQKHTLDTQKAWLRAASQQIRKSIEDLDRVTNWILEVQQQQNSLSVSDPPSNPPMFQTQIESIRQELHAGRLIHTNLAMALRLVIAKIARRDAVMSSSVPGELPYLWEPEAWDVEDEERAKSYERYTNEPLDGDLNALDVFEAQEQVEAESAQQAHERAIRGAGAYHTDDPEEIPEESEDDSDVSTLELAAREPEAGLRTASGTSVMSIDSDLAPAASVIVDAINSERLEARTHDPDVLHETPTYEAHDSNPDSAGFSTLPGSRDAVTRHLTLSAFVRSGRRRVLDRPVTPPGFTVVHHYTADELLTLSPEPPSYSFWQPTTAPRTLQIPRRLTNPFAISTEDRIRAEEFIAQRLDEIDPPEPSPLDEAIKLQRRECPTHGRRYTTYSLSVCFDSYEDYCVTIPRFMIFDWRPNTLPPREPRRALGGELMEEIPVQETICGPLYPKFMDSSLTTFNVVQELGLRGVLVNTVVEAELESAKDHGFINEERRRQLWDAWCEDSLGPVEYEEDGQEYVCGESPEHLMCCRRCYGEV